MQDEVAAGQAVIQGSIIKLHFSFEVDRMADKHKRHNESKIGRETIQENLLTIVVLVFSFIYFLFQLYAWFSSPQM